METIDEIMKVANSLTINDVKGYLDVYPELVASVEIIKKWLEKRTSFISVCHMVYGWMPTILKFHPAEYQEHFWTEIQIGCIEPSFLTKLKACINGSIIGASKVLHFLNPEQYAIWDRKICKKLYGTDNFNYANSITTFIKYTCSIRDYVATHEKELLGIKNIFMNKGYCDERTSLMRIVEMTIFYS